MFSLSSTNHTLIAFCCVYNKVACMDVCGLFVFSAAEMSQLSLEENSTAGGQGGHWAMAENNNSFSSNGNRHVTENSPALSDSSSYQDS